MNLLYLIVIGAVAGYLATRIMHIKADPLKTIAIGIAGALIGGFILQVVLTIAGLLGGIIGAVLGAILLIWIYQAVTAKKK